MSTPETEPSAPSEKKGFLNRYRFEIIGVIIFLIGTGLLLQSAKQSSNVPQVASADDRFAVMDVRVQNHEASISLYGDRISKLEKQVQDLSQSVASLPKQGASAEGQATTTPAGSATAAPVASSGEDAKRMEALEKEIAELKTQAPLQDAGHVAHSIKLLSSFHRLSDKVLSGKPYADALSAFQDEAGDTVKAKTLTDLTPYAESGIPTLAELLVSFDNASGQLGNAEAVPPAEAGAWDRLMYNLKHLVRVQRIDQAQTGKDADAVVGRAAAHLDKGEIEAAYAEINMLPDADKAHFSGWLDDAQIAMNAPGYISEIEEQVLQDVFHSKPQAAEAKPGNL